MLTYVSKEELFQRSDLISIHGPLIMGEGGTYHLINDKAISMMKDGVAKGQWTVDQPSDAMKASLQEIYKQIWDESYDKYGKDIMDVIISGEYRTLSES